MDKQTSFVAKTLENIAWRERELQKTIRLFRMNEILYRAIDERPLTNYETSISMWEGMDTAYLTIFYKIPSIKEMIQVLEFFEHMCAEEFTSHDNAEEGNRNFTLHSNNLDLHIELRVTPDETSENPTCRKVVVGEHVETRVTKTPIYELICE